MTPAGLVIAHPVTAGLVAADDPAPADRLLGDLLPAAVVAVATRGDVPGVVLFPEEAGAVRLAIPFRRREFATARCCARAALGRLGVAPVAVPRGPRGEPVWPVGVVGSMTHCRGYRAAAVARAGDVEAVGVDAEPAEPLPAGVLALVAGPGERSRLAALEAARPGRCWDRLLFSAKEAVFKAWFPLTGVPLDFRDVDVTLDPAQGIFAARLAARAASPRLPARVPGRFAAAEGLLVTACVL